MKNKNENKIFTFEMASNNKELEIHLDDNGINEFIEILEKLKKSTSSNHDHLMPPSCGGQELTEEKQGVDNIQIKQVSVHYWKE